MPFEERYKSTEGQVYKMLPRNISGIGQFQFRFSSRFIFSFGSEHTATHSPLLTPQTVKLSHLVHVFHRLNTCICVASLYGTHGNHRWFCLLPYKQLLLTVQGKDECSPLSYDNNLLRSENNGHITLQKTSFQLVIFSSQ